jgi:hypothetical protein
VKADSEFASEYIDFFAALDKNLKGFRKEFGTTTECQAKV